MFAPFYHIYLTKPLAYPALAIASVFGIILFAIQEIFIPMSRKKMSEGNDPAAQKISNRRRVLKRDLDRLGRLLQAGRLNQADLAAWIKESAHVRKVMHAFACLYYEELQDAQLTEEDLTSHIVQVTEEMTYTAGLGTAVGINPDDVDVFATCNTVLSDEDESSSDDSGKGSSAGFSAVCAPGSVTTPDGTRNEEADNQV